VVYWDLNTSEQMWTSSHNSVVTTCHMSPEHHLAVSGTDEGHFHMWDTRTGKLVCKTESKYKPALTSKKDIPKLEM